MLLYCNIEKNIKRKNHIGYLVLSVYICTRKKAVRIKFGLCRIFLNLRLRFIKRPVNIRIRVDKAR